MTAIIPNVTGISELQRYGKKALQPVLDDKSNEPVFLADRNNLFAVVLNITAYEKLVKEGEDEESKFWMNQIDSVLSEYESNIVSSLAKYIKNSKNISKIIHIED